MELRPGRQRTGEGHHEAVAVELERGGLVRADPQLARLRDGLIQLQHQAGLGQAGDALHIDRGVDELRALQEPGGAERDRGEREQAEGRGEPAPEAAGTGVGR